MESNAMKQDDDQNIITTIEESQPSTSSNIHNAELTPESNYEHEQLRKLYNEFEILQRENLKILQHMNYYKDINTTLRYNIESLKAYLRETNLQIEETDKRIQLFNQLTTYLRRHEQ
ncbi:uncharacterized protein LOC132945099 [Metopolophium dirhodum]|uniref:uncharacterized protein LOC132945099 n=1 Tax=Metopolophium dirhodum TaxID=44670 RepID=UPI00298FB1A4|nr:uncharacterized protein LOC132945099 [Metopolophium dirhodum]